MITSLDYVLLAIAVAVLPALSALRGRRLARTPPGQLNLVRHYGIIILRSLALGGLVAFAWAQAGRPWAALGLDWPIGRRGLAGLGAALVFAIYYGAQVFARKTPEQANRVRERLEKLYILPRTNAELAVYPILALVASPVEEVLYRGWLMWYLGTMMPVWSTVVSSGLVFGVAHIYQGRVGVIRTSIIGLGFGAAFALTRSLWWLMIAHSVFNLSGEVLAWKLLRVPKAAADA